MRLMHTRIPDFYQKVIEAGKKPPSGYQGGDKRALKTPKAQNWLLCV